MIINLFDPKSLVKSLSSLYGISAEKIMSLSYEASQENDSLLYFMNEAKIPVDVIDVKGVFLHCKHIATSIDNFESFKKYGFLTLNESLSNDTPLNQFLHSKQIFIDVENRTVTYNDKTFHIIESEEECKECFWGAECQNLKSIFSDNESLVSRDMSCDYRKAISNFRSKIYNDHGEIEVHLSGSNDDVHNYSMVKYHPEILITIDNMINKLFLSKVTLAKDWKEKTEGIYYCLDFDVNILSFNYITTSPYNDNHWYVQFLDFCQNDYSALDEVNKNFYGNLFLLGLGIDILSGGTPSRYGSINSSVQIPFDIIEVNKFNLL